jgi:hypothetical protein
MAQTPLLQGEIKKGRASLVGGIAVGAAVFALWFVLARDLGHSGIGALLPGAAIAIAVAAYIRIADL